MDGYHLRSSGYSGDAALLQIVISYRSDTFIFWGSYDPCFHVFHPKIRNWNHPGIDVTVSKSSGTADTQDKTTIQISPSMLLSCSSPSDGPERSDLASCLQRACVFLRQEVFINYLMDILQQLVHVFKSPSVSAETHGMSPGSGCDALLRVRRELPAGVIYGEKCKAAFDSVIKSVQTLQGLRRVLKSSFHQKRSDNLAAASRFVVSRSWNSCFGCASTFATQCLETLQVLSKHPSSKKKLIACGILRELFENNIHQGFKTARVQARAALCAFSEAEVNAVTELNSLLQKKMSSGSRDLRIVFQLLFRSKKLGTKHNLRLSTSSCGSSCYLMFLRL